MMEWIKDEIFGWFAVIICFAMLGFGLMVGDFFGGIGDKLFGKKPNDPS